MNRAHALQFEGNFKEYDADFRLPGIPSATKSARAGRRRKGAEADTPHRVAYKKLVRT